jgi:DNA-binding ferritin-like protein
MSSVEKLIDRAFKLRSAAHAAHWKATGEGSYARHVALGEFYDGLIDVLDRYVEAHQGTFGLVGRLAADTDDIVAQIRAELVWIAEHRTQVARGVPALENILDELTALHMSTLYKLEHLR